MRTGRSGSFAAAVTGISRSASGRDRLGDASRALGLGRRRRDADLRLGLGGGGERRSSGLDRGRRLFLFQLDHLRGEHLADERGLVGELRGRDLGSRLDGGPLDGNRLGDGLAAGLDSGSRRQRTVVEAHQESLRVASDPGLRVGAQIEDDARDWVGLRLVLRHADALDLVGSHRQARVGLGLHRSVEIHHEARRILELEALVGELTVALDAHQGLAAALDHFDALQAGRLSARRWRRDEGLLRSPFRHRRERSAVHRWKRLTGAQQQPCEGRPSQETAAARVAGSRLEFPLMPHAYASRPPNHYEGLSCLITSRNGFAAVGSRTSCLKTTSAT